MKDLYVCICLPILFYSGLAVPTTNRRGLRRIDEVSTEKGGYGIVGSELADIKKYPYTVSFVYPKYNYIIGAGAILNKYWIVCSAFEIMDYIHEEVSVRVGSNDAFFGGQKLSVSKIILHEKFDINYPYDVAVVKTNAPMKLNKKAKPVKLAKTTPKVGSKAQITGFGDTLSNSTGQLQVATVEVKSQTDCQKAHGTVGDTCLCADAENIGPCVYDLGDPLVQNKQLLGWFLGGDFCNYFKELEIYSNVAELRQWILDKIKENSNEDEMEGIDDNDFYISFDENDDE